VSLKTRLLLAFTALVLVFSALTLIFWDFMRDTILMPVYYVVWVFGLLVNSVPQGAFLTVLVLVSIFVGMKTLSAMRDEQRIRRVYQNQPAPGTRYLHWRTLCLLAYGNWFSKGRLSYEARKLVLSVIAYEQGVGIADAEVLVRSGAIPLPAALAEVVHTRYVPDTPLSSRFTGILAKLRYTLSRSEPPRDPQVERLINELIQFLETRMEMTHAGNSPES